MKIKTERSLKKPGSLATFTVAEIKKLIEGTADTDTVRVSQSKSYNQFDQGETTISITTEEDL